MNYGFCARCDHKLCVDIDQMRFDRPHANLESLRYLFVGEPEGQKLKYLQFPTCKRSVSHIPRKPSVRMRAEVGSPFKNFANGNNHFALMDVATNDSVNSGLYTLRDLKVGRSGIDYDCFRRWNPTASN